MMTQIRNPKSETNTKSDIRNRGFYNHFGFRASDLFRVSDFELRIFASSNSLIDSPFAGISIRGRFT